MEINLRHRKQKEYFLGFIPRQEEKYCKDQNGLFNGLICPIEQANFLFYTCSMTFLSGGLALYKQFYDLAFCTLAGAITGVTYWNYPTDSWKRYLDIIMVQVGLWWHVYRSIGAEYNLYYYILTAIGSVFFVLGWFFFKIDETWIGTYCHALVHFFANVSMIVLYLGRIEPIGILDIGNFNLL